MCCLADTACVHRGLFCRLVQSLLLNAESLLVCYLGDVGYVYRVSMSNTALSACPVNVVNCWINLVAVHTEELKYTCMKYFVFTMEICIPPSSLLFSVSF